MAICAICGTDILDGQEIILAPKDKKSPATTICKSCEVKVEQEFQQETEDANVPAGLLLGLAAAFVAGVIWYAVVVITGYELGLVAIAIGWLVGRLSKRLREQEDLYEGLFDHSESGTILVADTGGSRTMEAVNWKAADLLHRTIGDLRGVPVATIWNSDAVPDFFERIDRDGALYATETSFLLPDEKSFTVLLSAAPLRVDRLALEDHGGLGGRAGAVEDVARLEREEHLDRPPGGDLDAADPLDEVAGVHPSRRSGHLDPVEDAGDDGLGGDLLRLGLVGEGDAVPEDVVGHGLHVLGGHVGLAAQEGVGPRGQGQVERRVLREADLVRGDHRRSRRLTSARSSRVSVAAATVDAVLTTLSTYFTPSAM